MPRDITKALGLGRLVALQKPNGTVKGIVVGDLLRRLVARCLAQTYAEPIAAACRPHQFALSTRAGAEAVVHSITTAVQHNQALTILSIDGVGAYDTISRRSMLTALCTVPGANRCSSFVNMFYSEPSTYVWHDQHGNPHTITQAEGGEQGDPLMPALFSLGQRAALHTVQEELQDGESLFAFLDDIYVLVPPNRVRPVYDLLSHHLFTSAHIRLNAGKARVWNANGVPPPGIAPLGPNVWVGNQALPAEEQGLMILGTPVGSSQYQQHQLAHLRTQHDQLLQRIPELEDLQAFALNHPERMRAANEIPTGERLQPSQTMDHQAYEQAYEQLHQVDSRILPDVIKKVIQLFFRGAGMGPAWRGVGWDGSVAGTAG